VAAAWLHSDCCGALPAEVMDVANGVPAVPSHLSQRPARHTSIAAFLRRARLVPLVAAMWIGASMGAVIGKKRRTTTEEQPCITALVNDAPSHVTAIER
jgi:hypothetical protein